MGVDEVHLLGDVMSPQLLVELEKTSGLESLAMLVEGLFAGLQEIWNVDRKIEVQLTALSDTFQRAESEGAVLDYRASHIRAGVPTQ